jgi:Major Facilitator Superfamily
VIAPANLTPIETDLKTMTPVVEEVGQVGVTTKDLPIHSGDNTNHLAELKVEESCQELSNNNVTMTNDNSTGNPSSFMTAARSKALRPFVIISTSYLLFTITDGAIRLIVLLHAYNSGFSALQVAIMFSFYEGAGVITNLFAGLMGARWGIKYTLICGLFLQLFSYGLLFGWQSDWSQTHAIIYVTIAQMFAGVAKDLTKLGGKTVTKLVTPEERETQLFKLVSLLTGWKNSLKGVGYFLGSALLQISYETALVSMMALVLLALPWAITGLDHNLGTAKSKNASLRDVFNMSNPNLNWLSIARLFLFASRDFWFEVPLPFFLRSPACQGLGIDTCTVNFDCMDGALCGIETQLCENINSGGGCGGLGASRVVTGALLGGYIILYGQVQSWTPQLVTGPLKQTPPNKLTELLWGTINCVPTLVAAIVLQFSQSFEEHDQSVMTTWLVVIIVSFAVIFAINSSIHSYLVVKYAEKEKVAVSVGLYYMSNAIGRLVGTLGSGVLYTYVGETYNELSGSDSLAGLAACFYAGTACSVLAVLLTVKINDDKAGLSCGSCLKIVEPSAGDDVLLPEATTAMNVANTNLNLIRGSAECNPVRILHPQNHQSLGFDSTERLEV